MFEAARKPICGAKSAQPKGCINAPFGVWLATAVLLLLDVALGARGRPHEAEGRRPIPLPSDPRPS